MYLLLYNLIVHTQLAYVQLNWHLTVKYKQVIFNGGDNVLKEKYSEDNQPILVNIQHLFRLNNKRNAQAYVEFYLLIFIYHFIQ